MTDLDRLDAMAEKATKPPWRVERRYSNGCEIVPRIHCERSKDRECGWIANLIGAPYMGYESTIPNADFIAALVNAYAALSRELREARAK